MTFVSDHFETFLEEERKCARLDGASLNERIRYFDATPRTALVPCGSDAEQTLMLAEGAVTVTLRHVAEAAVRPLRLGHVRALGRLEFHLERVLLGPQPPRPLVVIHVRIFVVEAVVAELLLAPGVEPRATVELASVHIKHGGRLFKPSAR